MLEKIKEWDAVGITLLVNGEPENFTLAVIKENCFWCDDLRLFYAFVDDSKQMIITNVFSGGGTGCGTRDVQTTTDEWLKRYEIITTDMKEIWFLSAWEQEEEIRKEERGRKNI